MRLGFVGKVLLLAAVAVVMSAGTASAAVTGGTTEITTSQETLKHFVKKGVLFFTADPAESEGTDGAVTSTFPVTGGTGNLNTLSGTVEHGGSILVVNLRTLRCVRLTNIQFSVTRVEFSAQIAGTQERIPFLDMRGVTITRTGGGAGTVAAAGTELMPQAAAALNQRLGTTAFTEGQDFGPASVTITTDAV